MKLEQEFYSQIGEELTFLISKRTNLKINTSIEAIDSRFDQLLESDPSIQSEIDSNLADFETYSK